MSFDMRTVKSPVAALKRPGGKYADVIDALNALGPDEMLNIRLSTSPDVSVSGLETTVRSHYGKGVWTIGLRGDVMCIRRTRRASQPAEPEPAATSDLPAWYP